MGLLSGFVSFVSSAVELVGKTVGALATGLSKLGPIFSAVSTIVQIIGVMLDVLKPNEKMDELGAKAMQTDKKPEDFDKYSDYIEHLRNDIALDKKQFEKESPSDKLSRQIIGTAITIKGIDEEKGFDIPINAWVVMAKMGFEGKSSVEINAVLDAFKGDYDSLSKYTEGELSAKKEVEVSNTLCDLYKELEPNVSDKEIESKVMRMGG